MNRQTELMGQTESAYNTWVGSTKGTGDTDRGIRVT